MVIDSVLITSSLDLSVSQKGKIISVTLGGKPIEPILIVGTSLSNNCKAILVPYGSNVTIINNEQFAIGLSYVTDQNIISRLNQSQQTTFIAVRDMFIVKLDSQTLKDEIAPT